MSDNNHCAVCSCINRSTFDNDQTFLIDKRDFTEEFCQLFGTKSIFSLDVCLPYTSFVDVKTARSQKCLYFNVKKNPKNVFKGFLSILLKVYWNSFFSICDECVLGKGRVMFFRKSAWSFCYILMLDFCYILMLDFCLGVNLKSFKFMFESFVPIIDYDCNCFQILIITT